MKKSTKLLRRILATFLVVLISINSFAAVVGDNDGAAFITKAEFESLKNDFQSQINRYNSSLDSKIDGAIATYLSGVTIAKVSVFTPRIKDYTNIKWMNKFYWKARNLNYTARDTRTLTDVGWERIPYIRVRQIRQGGFRGWFMFQNDIAVCPIGVDGSPRPSTAGCLISYHSDGRGLLTPFWRLEEKNGAWSYLRASDGYLGLIFEQTLEDRMWGAYADSSGSWWNEGSPMWWGEYGYSFTPHNRAVDATHPEGTVTVNDPGTGNYLNMTMTYWGSSDWTNLNSATVTLNSKNTNLGAPRGYEWFAQTNWATLTEDDFVDFASDAFSYLPYTNAHIPYNNNTIRNNLTNVWKYFLLGEDDDTLCNVAYLMDSSKLKLGPQSKYDFSSADTVAVTMKNFRVNIYSATHPDGSTTAYSMIMPKKRKTVGDITFSYPLFPQIKHRDLTNGFMLIDGTTPAKVGDGLPLIKEVDADGTLELTLQGRNYNIENTSATVSNQKVKLYVKKNNFSTSNSADFYKLENGTTSLNGYGITNITSENKLKIPVKKGDEIWMRIGPNETVTTTTAPLFTQLSKLDMKITYDS